MLTVKEYLTKIDGEAYYTLSCKEYYYRVSTAKSTAVSVVMNSFFYFLYEIAKNKFTLETSQDFKESFFLQIFDKQEEFNWSREGNIFTLR